MPLVAIVGVSGDLNELVPRFIVNDRSLLVKRINESVTGGCIPWATARNAALRGSVMGFCQPCRWIDL